MTEIIPAIIVKDFTELKEKIEVVGPYVSWVQLDIMDGKFVPNTTWNEPKDLASLPAQEQEGLNFEAHLMIMAPEKYVEKWIDAGVKRIIFHIEATSNPSVIVKICKDRGVEVGVAVNPKTPLENLMGAVPVQSIKMVLVMGVTPGAGGQEFKPEVIPKIRALRKMHPYLTIGVDGGMNLKTAKEAQEAGANVIVAGSYIFGSKDVKKAIDELKNVCLS